MYDIKPLESEWKKYRKKRQKPWYIAGLIFLVMMLFVFFYSNVNIEVPKLNTYFTTAINSDEEVSNVVKSHVLLNDALVSLDIEEKVISEEVQISEKKVTIHVSEKTNSEAPKLLVDIPVLEEVSEPVKQNEEKKKVQIEIIETSSVTAYKDVERRFFQSHDVDDSLFLAKSYYKKGLYEKAEFWALETNKIDENIEESVLIFAKAKAKQGYKNEAESILMNYISKTASEEAKNVLFRIKNDTL